MSDNKNKFQFVIFKFASFFSEKKCELRRKTRRWDCNYWSGMIIKGLVRADRKRKVDLFAWILKKKSGSSFSATFPPCPIHQKNKQESQIANLNTSKGIFDFENQSKSHRQKVFQKSFKLAKFLSYFFVNFEEK